MKNPLMRNLILALILIMGLTLMIAGVITSKHGATVIGIIVSGVSVQQLLQWNNRIKSAEDQNSKS